MISAALNGDIEKLKKLKIEGYDFNVVDRQVSRTHVMFNYTKTSLIVKVKVILL